MVWRVKKLLVLPDLHIRKARRGLPGGEDKRSLKAVLAYAESRAPYDEIIQLGDFWDLPYFSRFEAGEYTLEEAIKCYQQDIEIGKKMLDRLGRLCDDLVVIEGNHDYRFHSYVKTHPHLEALLPSPGRIVESYGTWIPYWSDRSKVYNVGLANFIHGRYIIQNHPVKTAQRDFVGETVFYGHTHDSFSYSPVTRHRGFPPLCMSCGCLCRFDQPYLNGGPTNWQHMFLEFFVKPNGKFTFHTYRLFAGKFIDTNGKEWGV